MNTRDDHQKPGPAPGFCFCVAPAILPAAVKYGCAAERRVIVHRAGGGAGATQRQACHLVYSSRAMPSKRPLFMQHFLKPASGSAGAEVVAAELFFEQLLALYDAHSALHPRLGEISPFFSNSSL